MKRAYARSERENSADATLKAGPRKASPRWLVALLVPYLTVLLIHALWLTTARPSSGLQLALNRADTTAASVAAVEKILVVPSKSQMTYREMFQEIAAEYDLDWQLLAGQAYRESTFDPLAVGEADELGLMQILPSTWEEWAPQVGVSDPFDPYSNVLVGAIYLDFLREYFAGMGYRHAYWMLVAYNWGPRNLRESVGDDEGRIRVPLARHKYALSILEMAADGSTGWAEVQLDQIVSTSLTPGQVSAR